MAKIREGRWLCRSCGRENAGRDIACEAGCGIARPADVRFYLPQNSPIVTDPNLLAAAREKPNWNCDHCGGANQGSINGAKVLACGHCGQARDAADTTYQAQSYALGAVPRTDEAANPRRASRRNVKKQKSQTKASILKPVLMIMAACFAAALLIASFMVPTSYSSAEIADLSWERQITIEELRTVKDHGWQLPSSARLLSKENKVRRTIDVVVGHVPDTRMEMQTVKVGETTYVCGSRDLGNGFFQDVECTRDVTERRSVEVPYNRPITQKKDIIEIWYTYNIDRWIPVDTVIAKGGAETDPHWPALTDAPKRRPGAHRETYLTTLSLENGAQETSQVSRDAYAERQIGDEILIARNIWGRILDTKLVKEDE